MRLAATRWRAALLALVFVAMGFRDLRSQDVNATPLRIVLGDTDRDFVLDRRGDTLSVSATVTTQPRGTHDDWRFVLVQDSSGGLRIAAPAEDGLIEGLKPGDAVRVVGVLDQYRGAAELRALRVHRLGTSRLPDPRDVLVAEARSERFEGQRVRVIGTLTGRSSADGDLEFELSDRSGSIPVHLPARILESKIGARLIDGGHVDMVAIVGQADRDPPFDSEYRLAPAEPEDILFVSQPAYGRILVYVTVGLLVVIAILAVRGRRSAERRAVELSALYESLKKTDDALRDSIERKKQLEDQLRHSHKMEAVGRLAGGVAHDFNNLLTVITNYSAMLLEDGGPSHPMADELREINTAGQRATRLTQQLLAFSRKQFLKPRPVDLNALSVGLIPMLRRLIGEDVRIATVTDSRVGTVLADPGQLEQVIVNLVVNARDAMPAGGTVTIGTSVASAESLPESAGDVPAGDYIVLSVADTGAGMDAATQSHIFEPFFTTKAQALGTGLGLATVYGIVKQSGGFITVQSDIGRGSTFSIYLPRAADVAPAETPMDSGPAPRGSETILVVEDDEYVRRLVTRGLARQGYSVVAADGPAEAIRLVEDGRQRIDLVLTDIVMPEMNGTALAEAIRARNPEMRVIFMSGYTDDDMVRRGLLDPDVIFLQKPFAVETLSRAVRALFDGVGADQRDYMETSAR